MEDEYKGIMSPALVARRNRIQAMRRLLTEDWTLKKQFFAMYMANFGVTKQLCKQYYNILYDWGAIEEKTGEDKQVYVRKKPSTTTVEPQTEALI